MLLLTAGSAAYPLAVWLIPEGPLCMAGDGLHQNGGHMCVEGFWVILAAAVIGNLLGTAAFLSVTMSVMADISTGLSPSARTNSEQHPTTVFATVSMSLSLASQHPCLPAEVC
jgi:hypothetical protein